MKNILDDIHNDTFRRSYLLYGPETYLRGLYKQKLLKALAPDQDSMNYSRFEGKDTDPDAIISLADTLPFFADRRVILIEDSGFFKTRSDQLADYMKRLPEYLVLIFSEGEIDRRNRLYKAVQKDGRIAEFAAQKTEDLTRWILGILKREGRRITKRDMDLFLEMTGTDMGNISQELEKLLSYTMGREVITGEDIRAVCVPQITNRIFEMVGAVSSHQQKKALDCYYELLAQKEPPMRILFLLAREYNMILQIKSLAEEGMSTREIAGKVGLPPYVAGKYLPLCRQYSGRELQDMVENFIQTEEDVKTGRLQDTLSVELMIIQCSRKKTGSF